MRWSRRASQAHWFRPWGVKGRLVGRVPCHDGVGFGV